MLNFSDYLAEDLITFFDVSTRNEALDLLVNLVDKSGKLPDKTAFRKAIFEREDLISTGIGMGVALPHAKLKGCKDFFICTGIQTKKGIDWNAVDKAPIRLIFLIGGPEDRQAEYLQILSQLTLAIKNSQFRKQLMHVTNIDEVFTVLSNHIPKILQKPVTGTKIFAV